MINIYILKEVKENRDEEIPSVLDARLLVIQSIAFGIRSDNNLGHLDFLGVYLQGSWK